MSSTSATFSPPPGPGPSSIFLYQMILPLSISLVKSSLCVFPFHSLSLCIGTTFLGTISMHFSIDLCFSLFSISTVTISWPCTSIFYLLVLFSFLLVGSQQTSKSIIPSMSCSYIPSTKLWRHLCCKPK